jgi:hypothetical protein
MCPVLPEELLRFCVEMACYFFTAVAALVGFVLTGRT